jgi:hypothetical protein
MIFKDHTVYFGSNEFSFAAVPIMQNLMPLTKFENRGIKLGQGVWDLVFRKPA